LGWASSGLLDEDQEGWEKETFEKSILVSKSEDFRWFRLRQLQAIQAFLIGQQVPGSRAEPCSCVAAGDINDRILPFGSRRRRCQATRLQQISVKKPLPSGSPMAKFNGSPP
jgi:hypothetical protein